MAKFKVGDRVIVTGDTVETDHQIDVGSEAVVLRVSEYGGYSPEGRPEYFVSVRHTREQALDFEENEPEMHYDLYLECETEWVGEDDLRLNDSPAALRTELPQRPIDLTPFISEFKFTAAPDEPFALADMPEDSVNHPAHYTSDPSGVECIEIARHRNFNIGNALKYLWRAGLKDADAHTEDLRKAVWYINDEIDRLEGRDG